MAPQREPILVWRSTSAEHSVSKSGYQDALELEQRGLLDEIMRLKPFHDHTDGADRLRYALELQKLERRYRLVEACLQDLSREGDGIWKGMRIGLRRLQDEMVVGVEGWIERLDAKQGSKSTDRDSQDWHSDEVETP